MKAWFASLSDAAQRVVKVVIAAGAVTTSIGAIIALWPDPDPPPAMLGAEFSEVDVDDRRGSGGLPHDWLKKQRPATWEAEADQDSVSPNVWVPLPSARGPLFVRLIAEDVDGVPLTRSNTPRFGELATDDFATRARSKERTQ